MPRTTKPRKPYKTHADDETVERLVPIPGWVYNLMTERAIAEKRTTKYQIAHELEQLARNLKSKKDDGSGQRLASMSSR